MDHTEATSEPTLTAMTAAAEAARAANHAAYDAPRGDTSNLYDRAAALHDLLTKTEQLAQVLGQHVRRLRDVDGLRSTADDAAGQVAAAAAELDAAAARIQSAHIEVSGAWSKLSTLYVADSR